MSVIVNSRWLQAYEFRNLSQETITALCATFPNDQNFLTSLKLLECYCDITGQRLSSSAMDTSCAAELIAGFCGSMESDGIVGIAAGTRFAHLRKIIAACRNAGMSTDWEAPVGPNTVNPYCRSVWSSHSACLDLLAVEYWSAWPVVHRSGEVSGLRLSNLWNSHGHKFVRQFHEQCSIHMLKYAKNGKNFINEFAVFVSSNAELFPVDSFRDPIQLYVLFKSYRKYYFDQAAVRKLNKPARRREWNKGVLFMEETFIHGRIWAIPPGGRLPRVKATKTSGREANIKQTKDGALVRHKLITPVPLHLKDNDAIERLLSQVESDFSVVTGWARARIAEMEVAINVRNQLAMDGQTIDCSERKIGKHLSLKNICATYKDLGYNAPIQRFVKVANQRDLYKYSVSSLGEKLCIPSAGVLFAHQVLLVAKHPVITSRFISELDLYDERGDLKGVVTDGEVRYLVGYKRRRGQVLAEQRVMLDQESSHVIDQVLELTSPLREFLRLRGDENYRKLFLSSGLAVAYPQVACIPLWTKSSFGKHPYYRANIHFQFHQQTSLRDQDLDSFLFEVTLNSVRATSAVVEFIKNPSPANLAESLGHESYDPDLASSYLPDEVLDYFKSRHVRVFQRWLVVHAMKDSAMLLQATSFQNIDELEEFIRNNAYGDITGYLKDPEGVFSKKEDIGKIYIAVSPQALTALVSLCVCIRTAERPQEVSPKAHYWSRLGELTINEIMSGYDELLKSYVLYAEANVDSGAMESVIYEN